MLYINNNDIRLTRGDTAWLEVPINNKAAGKMYEIADDDTVFMTVRMGVKKSADDNSFLFQKRVVGSNVFHIAPEDTADLSYGDYHYDVELHTADGEVYTVIDDKTFTLLKEVT